MEQTVSHPPALFDEEEFRQRVAVELRKQEEIAAKRKALLSSKSFKATGNFHLFSLISFCLVKICFCLMQSV
jgi:hypothetical protein